MYQRSHDRLKLNWPVILLLGVIFIPRLLDLDAFLTADEGLFLQHARDFGRGMASGDWSLTLGIGYPGVTVAAWSALVVAGARTELAAYVAGRIVTALVTDLLLVAVYRLGRALLGRGPALAGVSLLALDPYTLAYSRLLHLETSLALLMTLAALAALLWLRDRRRSWLLLAGLLAGLALLTKSTAVLLGPLLGLLLFGGLLVTGQKRQDNSFTVSRSSSTPSPPVVLRFQAFNHAGVVPLPLHSILQALRATLYALAVIALIAGLVFVALWPAMWSQPGRALGLTLGKLLTDQEAGAGNLGLFWFGRYVEDPGPAFYPVVFLLKATPWLLLGLGLSLWSLLRPARVGPGPEPQALPGRRAARLTLLGLWLFALVYLVIMTIASKKSVRYLLPAFPALYLVAGLALDDFRKGWPVERLKNWPAGSLMPVLLLLVLSLFSLFYHPYYFTYYNPLVLGWRWAPRAILVGWGEGLDQAARYLNGRPEGETVAAWYDWLFAVFYPGRVEAVVPPDNLLTADHAVLYVNQVQRDIPDPNLVRYFRSRRRPEYTVRLAGIDYAWVYPGPVAGTRPAPAPQYALGGQFGDEARLLGYDLGPGPALSGSPLLVTLYWQALAAPAGNRFVYLRLVDGQGHIWARTDSPPVMGFWPTSRWRPGMVIEDAQELAIPPGTPPGTYRLEVGLYDPAGGQVLAATGQPVGQGGGLLLGEVPVAWQSLPAEADLPGRTDARLAPDVRLAGYEPPPPGAATGDLLPVTLAWREAGARWPSGQTADRYTVKFEWRREGRRWPGQQAELPLPVDQWGRGALLLSRHDVVVPPDLTGGRYELAVLLLGSSAEPAGEAFSLGPVQVTAPPHRFDLPAGARATAGPAGLAGGVNLAGYELRPSGQALALWLYWQAAQPVGTRYKVFAQLLDAGGNLVAQSDSFPAAGQRPTTGWLPGEIITDPHDLSLPADLPAGTYRLVAGLYDPATGARLPVAAGQGQPAPFPDALLVTGVSVP